VFTTAAADAGLHITGQWRKEDRAFVCVTTASGFHTLSGTDAFEAAPVTGKTGALRYRLQTGDC
jgi:hypothetical protein